MINYTYLKYLLSKIFTSFTDNFILKGLISIWMFFAGIHVYLYGVGALLLLDVVSGIYAAIRKGEPFTSKILKKGLMEKTALYLILMIAAFALENILKSIFPWQSYFVVFFVTVLISTYESVSICENIISINPNLKFLKSLINLSKQLNNKAIAIVEVKIKKIDGIEEPDEPKETDDEVKKD